MGSKKERGSKKDRDWSEPPPAARPFQALEALRSKLPDGPAAEASQQPAREEGEGRSANAEEALLIVVRLERKGRGGKTVTRLQGLPAEGLADWGQNLRRALGVGSSQEGEDLLLQGDLRERVRTWLESRGAEVRLGN